MMTSVEETLTTPAKRHSNNFNFLRIFFAFLVILSHSPELVDGDRHREILTRLFHTTVSLGEFAVKGFFILSGYLILKSWQSNPTASVYLKKRALRIVPGFVAAYLLSIFVVGPLGADSPRAYFARLPWKQVGLHLILLNVPPKNLHTFQTLPYPFVNGPLWTIVYEFGCYLLILALGVAGILRFHKSLLLLLLFFTFASVRHIPIGFSSVPLLGYSSIWPDMITNFLIGACFYAYRDYIAYRFRWVVVALLILAAALLTHKGVLFVLPFCEAYLLFFIGFYPAPRLAEIGTKADLSYGLYLYAWPVQTLLVWYFRAINPWLLCALTVVIASGLAWLSWNFIEKPALSLNPRNRRTAGETL